MSVGVSGLSSLGVGLVCSYEHSESPRVLNLEGERMADDKIDRGAPDRARDGRQRHGLRPDSDQAALA